MRFSSLGLLLCGALATSASPAAASATVDPFRPLVGASPFFAHTSRAEAWSAAVELVDSHGGGSAALGSSAGGGDDGEVCGTCAVEGGMQPLLDVLKANMKKWQAVVDLNVPYGVLLTQGGLEQFRFKKLPDTPRWVVVGANHQVHSTEIFEQKADGTAVFTPDEQEGAQIESMFWITVLSAECFQKDVTICSRFDQHTGAMTRASIKQASEQALLVEVLGNINIGRGVCQKACTEEYRPVCGTDNKTYSNVCFLNVARCLDPGLLSMAHEGECKDKAGMKQTGKAFLA